MSRQNWVEAPWVATVSGTAVANTTTETILFPNITIPANYLQGGRTLRLGAKGSYSDTATPTLIFTIRFGGVAGTVLCKTAAITLPSGVTAAMWELEVDIVTRSDGATGTLLADGWCRVHSAVAPTVGSSKGAPAVTPMTLNGVVTPATATVDLTADTALSLTATWSASSASNTLTGLHYRVESMN